MRECAKSASDARRNEKHAKVQIIVTPRKRKILRSREIVLRNKIGGAEVARDGAKKHNITTTKWKGYGAKDRERWKGESKE